jgi:hypothetical protein
VGWIFKSDLSNTRFQTYFGGGNPNVINFHQQTRFEIWYWSVSIWNFKQQEVLQVSCYVVLILDFYTTGIILCTLVKYDEAWLDLIRKHCEKNALNCWQLKCEELKFYSSLEQQHWSPNPCGLATLIPPTNCIRQD